MYKTLVIDYISWAAERDRHWFSKTSSVQFLLVFSPHLGSCQGIFFQFTFSAFEGKKSINSIKYEGMFFLFFKWTRVSMKRKRMSRAKKYKSFHMQKLKWSEVSVKHFFLIWFAWRTRLFSRPTTQIFFSFWWKKTLHFILWLVGHAVHQELGGLWNVN